MSEPLGYDCRFVGLHDKDDGSGFADPIRKTNLIGIQRGKQPAKRRNDGPCQTAFPEWRGRQSKPIARKSNSGSPEEHQVEEPVQVERGAHSSVQAPSEAGQGKNYRTLRPVQVETQGLSPIASQPPPLTSLVQKTRDIFHAIRDSLQSGDGEEEHTGLQPEQDGGDTAGEDGNFWTMNAAEVARIDKEELLQRSSIDWTLNVVREVLHQGASTPTAKNTAASFGRVESRGSSSGHSLTPSSSTPSSSGGKRKRTVGDWTDETNGEGDESEGQDDRPAKSTKQGAPGAPRFACPYFKRNPDKYRHERACSGPGWTSIHRLK